MIWCLNFFAGNGNEGISISTDSFDFIDLMCIFIKIIHMRTNIVIDDGLMRKAMTATGLSTKKEVVEEALKTLIRIKDQTSIRKLRGKVRWEGDLDKMRDW